MYNNPAVAMVNYEPGQDRNVAALSNLVMCNGFKLYERFKNKIYVYSPQRSSKSLRRG